MKILHFPLAKISFVFVLGILLFPYINTSPLFSLLTSLVALSLLLLLYFLGKRNAFFNSTFGILVLLNSFFIGILTASINKQTFYATHFSHLINETQNSFDGTVLIKEKLKNTKKNIRYVAEVRSIRNYEAIGKIIFNIAKNDSQIIIPVGSILKVKGSYYHNKDPFNPNQFDYGKYLENQEIYGHLYVKNDNVKVIGNENSIRSYFANYREGLITKLKGTSLSEHSLNVIVALLLGQKQELSLTVLKEYQAAGAVHILAVSGLHVGIIMYILLFLLKPIPNSKSGSFIKLIIIILGLWSFALLAGLSPSVVRSVTMFSFLTIGMNLRRTVNIYHTILVSILLILLVSPSFIYDVGFQMSYLAVFFIVWLQPMLKTIWKPKNKILNYFWDIITVSTAAQIGVLPLSIYYFHQFPGLFVVTNLIILPLLSFIMIFGIFVLVTLSTGFVLNFMVEILDFLLQIMNNSISWISSFDSFIFRDIPFTIQMLVVFYILIFSVIFALTKPSFRQISFALVAIIAVQTIFINQKEKTTIASEGIVFNQRKATIITDRIGKSVTLFATDSLQNESNENSNIQSYLVGNFSKVKQKMKIGNLLYINNKKVIVIDSTGIYNSNLKPDVLLIIQSPQINLDRLLQSMKPQIIIADASNYKSYSKLWEETCKKQKIPFHNTHEKGFYKF